MCVRRDLLLRFLLLYGMLYCSFGLSSPFLPAFLASRGIGSEWLGFLIGGGTAVRLLSAPFAGRLADVFGAFRLELALFAISAAVASLLYLPAHYFWLLALVNLTQAAMLAPLVPLSDALALSWSRSMTRGNSGAFEYGWVRGIGSAAFIAGVLVAGQSAAVWGLPSVLWLTAAGLFASALSIRLVPDLAPGTNSTTQKRKVIERDWLILLREPVYFPVGCSHAGDLQDSGEGLCYAAQRFPSSGACTLRFHTSIARRAGSPECNQIGLSSLSRLERSLAYCCGWFNATRRGGYLAASAVCDPGRMRRIPLAR
jgi:MFS family permease